MNSFLRVPLGPSFQHFPLILLVMPSSTDTTMLIFAVIGFPFLFLLLLLQMCYDHVVLLIYGMIRQHAQTKTKTESPTYGHQARPTGHGVKQAQSLFATEKAAASGFVV